MAHTNDNQTDISQQIKEADDTLRVKYLEIVESLSINELKRFDKHKYKQLVISEIADIVPSADLKKVDETAHYISNFLGNEAKRVKIRKMQTNRDQNQRITRRSIQTVTAKQTMDTKQNSNSANIVQNANSSEPAELSESIINALQSTMVDANDSLDSTISDSFMDETYEINENINDSLTEVKTIEQTKDKCNSRDNSTTVTATSKNSNHVAQISEAVINVAKSKTNNTNNKKPNKKQENLESETDIVCIDACSNTNSASIRCNMCMTWFHTVCVGISDVDGVGAWVCAHCRVMPETIKLMKLQISTLLETTTSLMKTFGNISEKLDREFGNLNDRITAVANQSKCSNQSSTDSMAELRQDINALKSNVDKKTEAILSKSQGIIDKVTNTTDLVGRMNINKPSNISGSNQTNQKQTKPKQIITPNELSTNQISNTSTDPINVDEEISNPHQSPETQTTAPQHKADLTFVTGSCILKTIETRFLAEKVRVKSYNKAKIEMLQEKLSEMDLSRYKNIVLHIGGHDVDAKTKPEEFKIKYQSLLQSLSEIDSKIYVSGLLPRGRTDMKPYNNILKSLSSQFQASFIDNHDSFIMASGELPFEYYQADRTNLKYPGTRLLVRNINNKCTILPSRSQNHNDNRRKPNHANFGRPNFKSNVRQPYRPRNQ